MNTHIAPGLLSGIMLREEGKGPKASAYRQLMNRPEIDDVICHYLDGETLKEALIVIDNIRAGGMKIRWSSVNVWSVLYKRRHVCDIILSNGKWSIHQVCEYNNTCECYKSYDPESMKRLIGALRDSLIGAHTACHASP